MLVLTATIKADYLNNNSLALGTAKGDVLRLVNAKLAQYGATNQPTGADVGAVTVDNLGEKTDKVTKRALKLHASLATGQCLITLHGETHTVTPMKGTPAVYAPDKDRGNAIIDAFVQAGQSPTLTAFERGLGTKYPLGGFTGSIVREDEVVGANLGVKERSAFFAGFLFLCVACGDQSRRDDVLIFFGAQHSDILDCFEYYAQYSDATWMKKRGRSYAFIRSQSH